VGWACLAPPADARPAIPSAPDAAPPKADSAATVHFGLAPTQRGEEADDIRQRYRPLIDYLGRRLGLRVELVAPKSYADAVDYLATGRVQFASLPSVSFVEAQRQNHKVKALLVELCWSPDRSSKRDTYASVVVALKSRTELVTLQDLKGRSFGFVSRDSSSGFVYPNGLLHREGIEYATFFSSYVFLGSHPRLTDALAAGSIDAGATWDFNLAEARKKHVDIFKILHAQPVPSGAIATHPSLGEARRKALKEALLAAAPALLEGLPTAGFAERPESFYDAVPLLLPAEPQ
jgi:phosphonate transport system substrate-binding protein